jgi:hypothetical protein
MVERGLRTRFSNLEARPETAIHPVAAVVRRLAFPPQPRHRGCSIER